MDMKEEVKEGYGVVKQNVDVSVGQSLSFISLTVSLSET